MPERRWEQVVKDTQEKKRQEVFGKIPQHVLDSPQWVEWQKKYSVKQILRLLEDQELPWEKKMEQVAVGDPAERLGTSFEEVLGRSDEIK